MAEHTWSMTLSSKPRRKGEVFIKRGEKFVMKLYKDGVEDPAKFGRYLCNQLNRLEAVKAAKELKKCRHEYEVEGDIEERVDGHLFHQCIHCGHIKE